jgi:lipoprotein-releasing system ATP-binding protein
MDKAPLLQATDIWKSYGTLQVLKGITLSVYRGEVVSIVGASGAGKSTLLHVLGTLDRPDRGRLVIGEQNVLSLSDKDIATFRNKRIGFVFQFHNLLPEFSALENVMIPALIAKRAEGEVRRRAVELLSLLGLADRLHHKPSQLSGGEQQRTAVARALINQPDLILADEPSGNLDSGNAAELHKLFFDLRDRFEQTFVIVTHNTDFAAMADRRMEIRDGIIE